MLKSLLQRVFVPSMAISQADRMGIFVLNRLSHSDVGLTDFAHQIGERAFIGLRTPHGCSCCGLHSL